MTTQKIGPCACRACLARRGYIAGWQAFPKWERRLYVGTVIVSALIFSALMAGCTPVGPAFDYNEYGGYVEACGELPPILGDDC